MTRSENGVATVLAASMTGVLVSITVGVACCVSVVGAHRTAQAAADLAALAGAGALQRGGEPCGVAAGIARDNRADLTRCRVSGWNVSVVVVSRARVPYARIEMPARAVAGPATT